MTVYVDDMYLYPMGQFRGMKMSHMIAETEAELHVMAARIGMARRWYQGDHYDVAVSKREAAIGFGAIPITMRQLAALSYLQRIGEEMGAPSTAVERMLASKAARRGIGASITQKIATAVPDNAKPQSSCGLPLFDADGEDLP